VDVKADASIPLSGFQFDVLFDPAMLGVVNVTEGGFLKRNGDTFFISPQVDNQRGRISGIACCSIGASEPTSAEGDSTLVTIALEVRGAVRGTTDDVLSFQNVLFVEPTRAETGWVRLMINEQHMLLQNYPNPFNPDTWIPYELSSTSDVTIRIYSTPGKLIRQLDLGQRKPGKYLDRHSAAYWDGRDALGQPVSSGVYYYRLDAGEFSKTRKMVILK
jgi:hypothetical protein